MSFELSVIQCTPIHCHSRHSLQGDVGGTTASNHCELLLCSGYLRKGPATGWPWQQEVNVAVALCVCVCESYRFFLEDDVQPPGLP